MHDVLIRRLLELGLFVPGDVQDSEDDVVKAILDSGLSTAFYPHGVGHLLGLDVHDVGGLPEGKSTNPLLRYLRLRVPLEEGFVVTVEPG
jgi:Xaa-Pro dipeptidase